MSDGGGAPLAGRVALVTGGGAGIGLAISRRLAAEGAALVVSDINEERAQAAAASIRDAGAQAEPAIADVRSKADSEAMVAVAERAFGGLDILVCNAGLVRGGVVEDLTDEDWDIVIDVILRGTFNAVRAAARLLMCPAGKEPDHHRKVVTISSVAGTYGGTTVNYSAAKGGVVGLSKALAREWAKQRINVNSIAPGRVAGTEIGKPADGGELPSFPLPEPDIPIGRSGTPEDIAALTAFLAGPDSDFLTGEVVEIHGGLPLMPRPD